MPRRRSGEKLSTYVGRFLKSKEAKKSFPSKKQRIAVAINWGKRQGRSK